jgi:hypothetical protein
MVLLSDDFKNNDKLKECARLDSAHIVADEPPLRRGVNDQGPHIALIHKALRKVMPNPKFGLEEPTEIYGPLTAEVVRQFKLGPPMLLNKALGQTTPDNIIGIQTIKALDTAVNKAKGKEVPDFPIPPIDPSQPFTVVPFNEPAPFLILRDPHDPNEDDLETGKRQPRISLPPLQQQKLGAARLMGKTLCQQTMKLELRGAAAELGADMAERFFRNNAVQDINFPSNGPLSQKVQKSPTFLARHAEFARNISDVLKVGIQERKVCDFHDLAAANGFLQLDLPNFPFFGEAVLKATIGGMKGADVFLTKFDASSDTRRWKGTLRYLLIDHFGINDTDLRFERGHGTQGQVCMWVLQHEHQPGNMPFISKFLFDVDASGPL